MVLEINCLTKLKTTLLFSILIICCFIYCFCYINSDRKSKYELSCMDFIIKITKINYKENKVVIEGVGKEKLLINYEGDFNYKLGDKVSIKGTLKEPSSNTNFNLYSYKKYLLSKRIFLVLDAEKIELIEKNRNVLYEIKNKIHNRLIGSAYLNAFILGDNSYIDDNVKKSYQINGISHLFAVSGMHVSFIVLILTFCLKKFKWYELTMVLMLLFYAFFTNFLPSIMRSVIFFILCLLKNKFKLKISTFNLFLIMTIFFLFYNPYYIYNIGFIYSFTISGFLIYFSDKLKEKKYFKSLIKISLLSFLVSLPITIYNNFSINLLSPILNLFFVPFVSLIIFPLSFLIFLLPLFNGIYLFLIDVLEQISLFCSNINYFNFIFARPSIYVILIYYIVIVLALKNKKYFIILFLIIIIHYNICIFKKSLVVTMLDVNQGDCLLISYPHNQGNILIDTGGKLFDNSNYISNNIIIPYVKSLGIKKIDYLILTHGDYDHIGEAINLVNSFKVDKVIFNCGEYNDLEKELIKVLNKKKIPYYSCIKELNINDNKLYFLNNNDYRNENDNSSVIYTELNKHKFLFMGDASIEIEKDLMEKYNLQNMDVLKVGHHGSKTSSSEEFIDNITPKYSIISVGKNNRYGHPNKEVLNNLQDSKVYRTDQDGSIMFKINNKFKIETCSP